MTCEKLDGEHIACTWYIETSITFNMHIKYLLFFVFQVWLRRTSLRWHFHLWSKEWRSRWEQYQLENFIWGQVGEPGPRWQGICIPNFLHKSMYDVWEDEFSDPVSDNQLLDLNPELWFLPGVMAKDASRSEGAMLSNRSMLYPSGQLRQKDVQSSDLESCVVLRGILMKQ